MKPLTPNSISLHFQYFKLIRSEHVLRMLLTNAHSQIYNQIDCFAFFLDKH